MVHSIVIHIHASHFEVSNVHESYVYFGVVSILARLGSGDVVSAANFTLFESILGHTRDQFWRPRGAKM